MSELHTEMREKREGDEHTGRKKREQDTSVREKERNKKRRERGNETWKIKIVLCLTLLRGRFISTEMKKGKEEQKMKKKSRSG